MPENMTTPDLGAAAWVALKARLCRANDNALDDMIDLLAASGSDPAAVLEFLVDLMGSKRAAAVWCDRSDTVGNAAWWQAVRRRTDYHAAGDCPRRPWLNWEIKAL